jgi:hypothetical protein
MIGDLDLGYEGVEVGDGQTPNASDPVCPLWVDPARFVAVSTIDDEVVEFRTSKFFAIYQGGHFSGIRTAVVLPAL